MEKSLGSWLQRLAVVAIAALGLSCALISVAPASAIAPAPQLQAFAEEGTDSEDVDQTFQVSIDGKNLAVASVETDAYVYQDYYKGEMKVPLYTVYVPAGTQKVQLTFAKPRLVYNYTGSNGTYLAGWVDDYTAGATSVEASTDFNNDGTYDCLQVQRPYKSDYSDGTLLYAITFKDVPAAATTAQLKAAYTALSSRFVKGAKDAAVSNATFYAAEALNVVGEGALLDEQGMLDQLAKSKEDSWFSAGTYAKYILALTAAGVDCRQAAVNGSTVDLVAEMENMIGDLSSIDVWSAVCLLPVYSYKMYEPGISNLEESLINTILSAADENGLLGGWGYFDSQTTAQGLLALYPYQDENEKVSKYVSKALATIQAMQLPDGGFAYQSGDTESNLDATANIAAMLPAYGVDPNGKTAYGSSAMGYLVSKADEGYGSYNKESASNEAMTASTALAAVAAAISENNIQDLHKVDKIRISSVKVVAGTFTYNGKAKTPAVTVTSAAGRTLAQGTDYTVSYKNNVNAGTAAVAVEGVGVYQGSLPATFTIAKAAQQPAVAKAQLTKTVKAKKVKKAKRTTTKVKVTGAKGKVTYVKLKGSSKKLTIGKTTGKITVKKGTKKGTYKIKVKVTAAGNANYAAKSITKTIKVKVK